MHAPLATHASNERSYHRRIFRLPAALIFIFGCHHSSVFSLSRNSGLSDFHFSLMHVYLISLLFAPQIKVHCAGAGASKVFNFGFAPSHRDAIKVFVVNKLARRFRNNCCLLYWFLDAIRSTRLRVFIKILQRRVCEFRNQYVREFRIGFRRRLFLGVAH